MGSRRTSGGGRTQSFRVSVENRAAMAAILLVVCVLFAVLFYEGSRLKNRISSNEVKRIELEAAIEEENRRTEEIEARREYMQSDEYVKQAAKDRLGLVESGEIIFRPLE